MEGSAPPDRCKLHSGAQGCDLTPLKYTWSRPLHTSHVTQSVPMRQRPAASISQVGKLRPEASVQGAPGPGLDSFPAVG